MTTSSTPSHQSPATERGSAFLDPAVYGGPMRLADLVEGYWAITAPMHDEIRAIYDAHMRGDKIDIKGVEARLGRPLANERTPYTVLPGGVALFGMSGVISPKANMFTQVSGGTSAQQLRADILAAQNDPSVRSGILYGDTPGGNVLGIAEGAAAWRDFAAAKPAVTFSDGTLASAGYWWGSAGSRVFISGPMVNVGSIGVRTEIVDTTEADARNGIKRRVITAGKYKAAGADLQDAEGIAYKQAQVDYLYTLFVDTVAQHRGASTDQVLADMADGRVFIGQQAIDAGLVDGFATLEDLASKMADNPLAVAPLRKQKSSTNRRATTAISVPATYSVQVPAGAASASMAAVVNSPDEPVPPVIASSNQPQGIIAMNREELERNHPALVAEIRAEATAAATAEGATAERTRIQTVLEQSMPGHEALVQKLAFDGKTTGPEAAVQVLNAHRAVLKGAASAHFADAPPAVATAAQVGDEGQKGDKPEKRMPNVSQAYASLNSGSKATA